MGFTIYWEQVFPISQVVWDTFLHRALHLIKRRRTGKVELENRYANQRLTVLQFRGLKGGETFTIDKENHDGVSGFCKTNRNPYTTDVFICLILMYDLGMLERFSSDDMNEQYPEALAYVKEHYALKRSYEKLKYMGQYADSQNDPIKTPSALSQRPRKQRTKKAAKKQEAKKSSRKQRTKKA